MMAPAAAVYQYQPLEDPDQIRVLTLAPRSTGDALSGDIQHIRLGSVPYEALSYEWGAQERSHTFNLPNDRPVRITQSLHTALQDLRREDEVRVIWADGVCINQDDLHEREQQVAIMGQIYRKASRIITYIGPEKDASSIALEHAEYLLKYALLRWGHPDPRLHNTEEFANIGLRPISDPRWPALRSLLLRGWVSGDALY